MDKHLYSEVYIVGADSTVSDWGELTVCGSFEDLLEYLKTKSVGISSDLRVIHGVLTSAKTIPSEFKSRQPFILVQDPESSDHGILLDSDSEDDCNELASEIERLMESGEVASFFVEIDHIYILYGYELNLTLSVDEDDLDEDIIADCIEVAEAARRLNKDE
jgi:hypothetical protein